MSVNKNARFESSRIYYLFTEHLTNKVCFFLFVPQSRKNYLTTFAEFMNEYSLHFLNS